MAIIQDTINFFFDCLECRDLFLNTAVCTTSGMPDNIWRLSIQKMAAVASKETIYSIFWTKYELPWPGTAYSSYAKKLCSNVVSSLLNFHKYRTKERYKLRQWNILLWLLGSKLPQNREDSEAGLPSYMMTSLAFGFTEASFLLVHSKKMYQIVTRMLVLHRGGQRMAPKEVKDKLR